LADDCTVAEKLVPHLNSLAGCPSLQLTNFAVRPASMSRSVVGAADDDPPIYVQVTAVPAHDW
jgi:hypothetical protein